MLETVRALGYDGIELGPPGYFGDDPGEVVGRLARYGLELARSARDRIAHLHLKDVDRRVLDRVRASELSVEQAWEQGLFCPFGEGAVDFGAVLAELDTFDGWMVIEQDRVAVRIDDLESVCDVEVRNLAVVRQATGR